MVLQSQAPGRSSGQILGLIVPATALCELEGLMHRRNVLVEVLQLLKLPINVDIVLAAEAEPWISVAP
jgi:hypothetical protein